MNAWQAELRRRRRSELIELEMNKPMATLHACSRKKEREREGAGLILSDLFE